MNNKLLLAVLLLLSIASPALAVTFTEDFESYAAGGFTPDITPTPDPAWYVYSQQSDVGLIVATDPINGAQSFDLTGGIGALSTRRADFTLSNPTDLTEIEFTIRGEAFVEDSIGTQQFVTIQSSAPVRTMVEFYLFCNSPGSPNNCELRVRSEHIDTTGQILVNFTAGSDTYKIEVFPNWLTAQFCLEVDDVNDGCFDFLELPDDVGRVRFSQYRGDVRMDMTVDDFIITGALPVSDTAVEGDVATGIKNFATDINFTSSGSLFFLGLLIFFVIAAAVIVPVLTFGMDNTVYPALTFFLILDAMWLVFIEFWPEWVGISLIIATSALIAIVVRRFLMGMTNSASGAGMAAGSLGYFIIASAFLGFSGYATDEITLPTGQAEEDASTTDNATVEEQGFVEATLECIVSGGAFTFGLRGDCSRQTEGKVWKKLTDVASSIFNWVRTGFDFLFQLLTFQLPIPVLFNMMIVLPPAVGLAAYAISVIRGAA